MANQLLLGRALDANGYVAPGAKATVYAAGTSTLITVYSDADGTTAAANPIIADASGFWPQRFVSLAAKVVVTDADDAALYTVDPAPVSQGTGAAGASAIPFAPSVDVPKSNVQDAIDHVAASVISGFSAYGIGITGNAALLANIDATGTGAGIYRFDGTSTGTFPTGVVASDTGMIELWRQAGATAMQELHHATTNRVFRRRMTSSVWGAWREILTAAQSAAEGDTIYRGATDWTRLAKGTAGQLLRMNTGATAPEWADLTITGVSSSISLTASPSSEITGIPSWANEVAAFFRGVAPGAVDLGLRLGGTGGYATSGYVSTSSRQPTSGNSTSSSSRFIFDTSVTAYSVWGMVILKRGIGNIWSQSHALRMGTAAICVGAGDVELSEALTRLEIAPASGNFTASGSWHVRWSV